MVELSSWLFWGKYIERRFMPYTNWNVQRGSSSVAIKARDIGEAQRKALPLLNRMDMVKYENYLRTQKEKILYITQGQ